MFQQILDALKIYFKKTLRGKNDKENRGFYFLQNTCQILSLTFKQPPI